MDLVDKLRLAVAFRDIYGEEPVDVDMLEAAADELETLRARVKELEEEASGKFKFGGVTWKKWQDWQNGLHISWRPQQRGLAPSVGIFAKNEGWYVSGYAGNYQDLRAAMTAAIEYAKREGE